MTEVATVMTSIQYSQPRHTSNMARHRDIVPGAHRETVSIAYGPFVLEFIAPPVLETPVLR